MNTLKATNFAEQIVSHSSMGWPGFSAPQIVLRLQRLMNTQELEYLFDEIKKKNAEQARNAVIERVPKLFDV